MLFRINYMVNEHKTCQTYMLLSCWRISLQAFIYPSYNFPVFVWRVDLCCSAFCCGVLKIITNKSLHLIKNSKHEKYNLYFSYSNEANVHLFSCVDFYLYKHCFVVINLKNNHKKEPITLLINLEQPIIICNYF